ncbi:MAG TPA: DUF3459 domain-containing protein, partial [Ardenticatenaceae bacterium]|nr:DUF3459 domain-containing protein [Ardenticatenaceae bacterium]
VYTADELGEWYRPYSDPVPLAWEEKYEGLRDYYRKLIALRKEVASLHSRQWLPLTVNPSRQLYAYVRYLEPSGAPVLVLLNFSDEDVEAEVVLPDEFQALAEGGTLLDLLADEQVQVSGASPSRIAMPAFTARIMRQA